jgi:hypothetical protein
MRNARGKLFDERAVAGLDGFGGDRQGAARGSTTGNPARSSAATVAS